MTRLIALLALVTFPNFARAAITMDEGWVEARSSLDGEGIASKTFRSQGRKRSLSATWNAVGVEIQVVNKRGETVGTASISPGGHIKVDGDILDVNFAYYDSSSVTLTVVGIDGNSAWRQTVAIPLE